MAGKKDGLTGNASFVEVLSGGSATWRPLTSAEDVDEQIKTAAMSASADLQDQLSLAVNAEHLVVLTGLGTSIGVTSADGTRAAPTMAALWDAVAALDTFESATSGFASRSAAQSNFEHLLSEAQARASLDPDNADLSGFIGEAERIVLEKCGFVDHGSPLPQHETFLRKVARRSTRLQRTQLFTTNYDRAFEVAARRARFNVIDGFGYGGTTFDGSTFDLDYVRRRPNESPALEPNVFHLLKLHGSVDWDQFGDVVQKTVVSPANPVLIYPSATKYQLSYRQPYLEFMSRFQIALRQPDVGLIVVGFGFNDAHIVAPIEAALRSNIGLRAVIVGPAMKSDPRPDVISDVERLIGLGDRRLTLLNGKFEDLVRLLPDVPQFEERTAHQDRFERRAGDTRR